MSAAFIVDLICPSPSLAFEAHNPYSSQNFPFEEGTTSWPFYGHLAGQSTGRRPKI